jgi:hypothetical protein
MYGRPAPLTTAGPSQGDLEMKKQLLLPVLASTLVLASSFAAAQAQQGAAGPMLRSDHPSGGMMRQHRAEEEEDEGGRQRGQPRSGMHRMMGPRMLTLMLIMMDTDNDGALSLAEVQAVHARMFTYVDGDDDGKVTLEELQRFFRGHQGDRED